MSFMKLLKKSRFGSGITSFFSISWEYHKDRKKDLSPELGNKSSFCYRAIIPLLLAIWLSKYDKF